MLRKDTWSRQCGCVNNLLLHLWSFLAYSNTTLVLAAIDGIDREEGLIEALPVISTEFGLFSFWVAFGCYVGFTIWWFARRFEAECDALGHGVSS